MLASVPAKTRRMTNPVTMSAYAAPMRRTHWFGEDVEAIDTTFDRLPALLPVFERYGLGCNKFSDVISRSSANGADPLPVGVVSKKLMAHLVNV